MLLANKIGVQSGAILIASLLILFGCKPDEPLSQSDSSVIIIDIWEPWCAPCIAGFRRMAAKNKSKDVQVILYSSDATSEEAVRIPGKNGASGLISLRDPFRLLYRFYKVKSLPHWLIIDPAIGGVVYSGPPKWELKSVVATTESPDLFDLIAVDSLCEIELALSDDQSYNENWGEVLRFDRENRTIEAKGWSLSNFICVQLLGLPPARTSSMVADIYVDVKIQYHGTQVPSSHIANQLLQFMEWKLDSTKTYTQVALMNGIHNIDSVRSGHSSNWVIQDGRFIARNVNMGHLALAFESWYERPFESNGNDSTFFDLEFILPQTIDSLIIQLYSNGIIAEVLNRHINTFMLYKPE